MSNKQFYATCLVILAFLVIVGPIGFFMNSQAKINREAEIKQAEIAARSAIEQAKITQGEETKRTKERWEWTQRIPGLKADAQKSE